MVFGCDEDELGITDPVKLDVLRCNVHRGDDQIHLVVAKPTHPLLTGTGLHLDPRIGIALLEPLQVRRQEIGCGSLPRSDAQSVRNDTEVLFDERVRQPVHPVHQGHGAPIEPLADRAEGDAGTAALEQQHPELLFQRADLHRHRRLARHDLPGRPGDAPEPCGLTERPELLEPIAPVVVLVLVPVHGAVKRLLSTRMTSNLKRTDRF